MRGMRDRGVTAAAPSGERTGQDLRLNAAEAMGAAGLEVHEDDLGRAEEVRVNRVEVVVVACENGRERLAVVARGGRRHLRADLGERVVVARDVEDDPGPVEDRVVRAAD